MTSSGTFYLYHRDTRPIHLTLHMCPPSDAKGSHTALGTDALCAGNLPAIALPCSIPSVARPL